MANGVPHVKGFLFLALAVCFLILCAPGTPAADDDSRTPRPARPIGEEESGMSCSDSGDDSGGVIRIAFENGITGRIYTAEYLTRSMRVLSGKTIVVLDGGETLEVITDVRDPLVENEGDGLFHPFDEEHVMRALREITYPALRVDIDIYILPFPRRELPASSTRGSEIFLSPHVRELSYEGTSFIVAHEAGHVFQNRHLPLRDASRWSEYERIRAISDERLFSAAAEHAYRPVEIYAEDFRVLFGGEAARYDGRIENPELCSPECAAGLEEFFLSLADEPAEEIAAGQMSLVAPQILRRVLNPSLL